MSNWITCHKIGVLFLSFDKNACSKRHTVCDEYVGCLATVELCVFCAYGFGCTHFLFWGDDILRGNNEI